MRNIWRILLVLPLLCVGVIALQRIIHRIDELKTWTDALAYCREHHIDLVTIRNETENQEITLSGWIGLYRDLSDWKWKWSRTNQIATFTTWQPGEPDINQYCGYKKEGDKGWHSKYCSTPLPFYCFDEPLIFVTEEKTWEEALEHCRHLPVWHHTVYQNHRYDLASPLTPDDNAIAQRMWEKEAGMWRWIGLRYLGDQWNWISGESYDEHWEYCPTINRCGMLERNIAFNLGKNKCNSKHFFLCSRVPGLV